MSDEAKDPILEAELERALAPYRGVLPAEVLQEFRDALEHALTKHPTGSLLLARVRPRQAPDHSDEVPTGLSEAAAAALDKRKKEAG